VKSDIKLPEHKCGLTITHNEHRNYYQTAAAYIQEYGTDLGQWKSGDALKRAIETDQIWSIHWYPTTPVGFCVVFAPTLEEALELANEK